MRTILVFLVLAGALWAQQGPTETELARFDQFLDSHPQVRSELIKDPKLIDNENFIINHPDLADFLHTHPGVKGQILSNPQAFMTRERAFEKSEATPQPHMQSALEHLRQAQKELEQAEGKVEILLKQNGKLQAESFEPLTEAPASRK